MDKWFKGVWESMERTFERVERAIDGTTTGEAGAAYVVKTTDGKGDGKLQYRVVSDTDAEMVLTFDVPGVSKKDVEIEAIGTDQLKVIGTREGRTKLTWKIRFPRISFDPDSICATMADGVLTLKIKKAPRADSPVRKIGVS